MNTLLLPPPHLHRLLPLHFPPPPHFLRNRHHFLLSAASQQLNLTSINGDDERDPYDVALLPNPHYDFAPLLDFLSTHDNSSQPDPPTTLDPAELRLAESYGARHNLCFSYELLYSILINALGRNEKLYEAFLLSQRQSLTPLTYNALIGACARNGDLEKALNLMERMRRDGYQSDFVNYSLIIQSLMRNNIIDVAILEKLYGEMEADRIELDGQLLNDIIAGFAKAGDIDRALYFLGVMQGNGLSAKTSTVVMVVNELGNLGRVDEAEAVFEELKEGGLKPRTRAYNALLKGYVKVGALKDAEYIVSEMESSGVLPDEHTYSLLIDAYGNAGRWESARIVLKEMEANGVKPNSYVFSRILASYRDRGEWQRSFQVLKEMKNCGVHPDRQFYNVMIDTFGKYNCLDHMMTAFERMKVEGLSQIRWDDVKELLGKMQSQGLLPNVSAGLKPSSTMYNALINAYAQKDEPYFVMAKCSIGPPCIKNLIPLIQGLSEQAVNAFRVMRGDGLKPSLLALNSLINAFGEDRRDSEAFAVLQYMRDNDLKPDVVTYTTLMKALIRVEKYEKVPAVFEEMLLSGCAPDRKARAMLRSALKYMKSTLRL
ncbi:hypothetical protein DH2020_034794 [Rehmannia glutinosa]|uniref:Pentatricopeptide repeat-containing protein n=1 Tax=Rehmannia glutinosa TaxID=99300 RepID=A0ABR0V883_REHGL